MAALAEFVTEYPPSFVPVREDRLSLSGLALPVVLRLTVDPFAAEAVVYRPGVAPELLHRPAWVEANEVVVGFQLEMERLWAK